MNIKCIESDISTCVDTATDKQNNKQTAKYIKDLYWYYIYKYDGIPPWLLFSYRKPDEIPNTVNILTKKQIHDKYLMDNNLSPAHKRYNSDIITTRSVSNQYKHERNTATPTTLKLSSKSTDLSISDSLFNQINLKLDK